ncbi:MAG: hypothetical protein KIT11_02470 [Fimbriimonadaceae bacterium]|nr:hypothetical protein [Fimbriimonadaceae bacterium]QYK54768.1 MAG: hypothetical protein KF733_07065 [Fimbriimonadaceae bacterium]
MPAVREARRLWARCRDEGMKSKLLSILLLVLGVGMAVTAPVVLVGCGEAAESAEEDDD